MNLSNEDALRLNVMMQQPVEAVRINESNMTVYALLPEKEISVSLSPNCNDDRYLREVRQLLSSYALNSPEGFPVYLSRWNRMGQIKSEKLEGLLKIGEPEAVLAVVQTEGLSETLAKRAWWCMPSSEIARLLLGRQQLGQGELARELVDFLLEFLPFEEEPIAMIESSRQVVQSGLLSADELAALWKKGKRRAGIRIGFLAANPELIPETVPTSFEFDTSQLDEEMQQGMEELLSESGRKFLKGITEVMDRLPNQDAAIYFCDVIHRHFRWANPKGFTPTHWDQIEKERDRLLDALPASLDQAWRDKLLPVLTLSLISQSILNPILSQTDAVGTVMRKKLEPVTHLIQQQLQMLGYN